MTGHHGTDWPTAVLMVVSFLTPVWWPTLDDVSHVAALILPLAALTWWGLKIILEVIGFVKEIRKKNK